MLQSKTLRAKSSFKDNKATPHSNKEEDHRKFELEEQPKDSEVNLEPMPVTPTLVDSNLCTFTILHSAQLQASEDTAIPNLELSKSNSLKSAVFQATLTGINTNSLEVFNSSFNSLVVTSINTSTEATNISTSMEVINIITMVMASIITRRINQDTIPSNMSTMLDTSKDSRRVTIDSFMKLLDMDMVTAHKDSKLKLSKELELDNKEDQAHKDQDHKDQLQDSEPKEPLSDHKDSCQPSLLRCQLQHHNNKDLELQPQLKDLPKDLKETQDSRQDLLHNQTSQDSQLVANPGQLKEHLPELSQSAVPRLNSNKDKQSNLPKPSLKETNSSLQLFNSRKKGQ